LSNNKLKRIESITFRGQISLERLFLSNNQIEEIDVNLLVDLKNLIVLYLFNNKLKRIERRCFEHLRLIGVISLFGNEFVSKTSSFLNESLMVNYGLQSNKGYLNENGGYISTWGEFLKQFF